MLRACIVGTGPSGMYSAKYLLKQWPATSRVDLIERLPTPYGLVRFGVAPDHQEVKSVMNDFAEVARDPRVRYFGNVSVGTDVTVDQLRERYDVVLLAYGADHDRQLGLENEHVYVRGAREFVAWYNGHPDVSKETSEYFRHAVRNSESCVIVGNGNVAVDCARVLLSKVDKLKTTDIAERALEALCGSTIKSIHIVGRRGHAQAAFTMKELRELTKMDDVCFRVFRSELDLGGHTASSMKEIETQRATKRMDALLRDTLLRDKEKPASRLITLRFLLSPTQIVMSDNKLSAMRFQKMSLTGSVGHQTAHGRGEYEDIPCQMALRSVGYRAVPLEPSLPFDSKRGVIPTRDGGKVSDGLYAVGWVKRGPTGIIGTNIPDAHETVEAIMHDMPTFNLLKKNQYDDLETLLQRNKVKSIDWKGFTNIERKEEERGEKSVPQRPRVKFETKEDMLRAAECQNMSTASS